MGFGRPELPERVNLPRDELLVGRRVIASRPTYSFALVRARAQVDASRRCRVSVQEGVGTARLAREQAQVTLNVPAKDA